MYKTLQIKGTEKYPGLHGTVSFSRMKKGVLITAEIFGLPYSAEGFDIYAFHIHDGVCGGEGGHYNPGKMLHPYHAGDLPPLFGNSGYAYMSVFTERLSMEELAGKSIVIHRNPDDFTTQPSGNAGEKIACGNIM